jgi:carbon storage regulator
MLVITRRVGEAFKIGDNISIIALGIKEQKTSMGIDAPKEISVHREEIYQYIQKEKQNNTAEEEHSDVKNEITMP